VAAKLGHFPAFARLVRNFADLVDSARTRLEASDGLVHGISSGFRARAGVPGADSAYQRCEGPSASPPKRAERAMYARPESGPTNKNGRNESMKD
jgi:hypothetical protein